MWRFVRPDAIEVLHDEKCVKSLSRYFGVFQDRKKAKFLIAKKLAADFSYEDSTDELWKQHGELTDQFYDLQRKVDGGDVNLDGLPTPNSSYLDLKIEIARRIMQSCHFCERRCEVDRLKGELGWCNCGPDIAVSSMFTHVGEEAALVPSWTIFAMGCNLYCVHCFHPETVVVTEKGLATIGSIFERASSLDYIDQDGTLLKRTRTKVISSSGRFRRVLLTSKHMYDGELIVIKPHHLPDIKCTANHKVLIYDDEAKRIKEVYASEVKRGDWLIVPKLMSHEVTKTIDVRRILNRYTRIVLKRHNRKLTPDILGKIVTLRSKGLSSRAIGKATGFHPAYIRTLLSKYRRLGKDSLFYLRNSFIERDGRIKFKYERGCGIPTKIELNREFSRLLGYYCAEGYVAKSKNRPNSYCLRISFGKHERNLVEDCVNLFESIFNYSPVTYDQGRETIVQVGKASIALLFKSLCGSNSHEKKVPLEIQNASYENISSFLNGVILGDGWTGGDVISIDTISKKLALGLYYLFLRLGTFPSLYRCIPPKVKEIGGRTVRQSPLYYVKAKASQLTLCGNALPRFVKDRKRFYAVKVNKVYSEQYSGPVYNLTVENEHSYLANFIGVKNCQNWSISRWYEKGRIWDPEYLARAIDDARRSGNRNANLVGGEPTPWLWRWLQTFKHVKENMSVVWNSNSYYSEETAKLLAGFADVYLNDFKYGNNECATRISSAPRYWDICTRNMLIAKKYGELLIRVLVLPEHLECCTRPILHWISKNLGPMTRVNVMWQYRPEFEAYKVPELRRRLTREEKERTIELAREAGLKSVEPFH